jgi:hypothetical protein
MKPTMLNSESLAVVLLPLGIALVVFYIYIYAREARQARQLTGSQKLLLRSLRIVVALLAVLAIVRPAVSMVRSETRLPVVPIVVDESTSMGYPDARENAVAIQGGGGKRTRFETAALVAQLLQEKLTLTHRVKVYTFSDTLKLLKDLPHRTSESTPAVTRDDLFPISMKPAGEYTNVGDAMDSTISDLAGDRISGMVLLSDGRETGGTPMKEIGAKAAKFGIPVHTIVEGNEFPLVDLRIDEVIVDNETSMNDVLVVQLKVTNQVSDVLDTELTMLDKTTKKPTIKKFKLKRGQSTIAVTTVPDSIGVHDYHVEFPKYPDEVNIENNAADFSVNVVKRDMRTLLIAGAPNREYFYLVPALLRHPTINLAVWLQSAGPLYTHQGHTTLTQLPKTAEEFKVYDVVILYDANPNKLEESQMAAIEDIVKRGAGLMIIGGPNFSLAAMVQVHPTLFRQLLPVEIDKGQLPNPDIIHDKPFSVERTDQGKTHETLQASGDPKKNDQIWASFPKLYWAHPVQGLKSGATELLHRSDVKGKTGAVMAVMRYGNGKVFYSGLNNMWRWRFPAESYDFDNFWLRTLRYLGTKEEGGKQTNQVALNTDKSSYSPGEDVQITMKLLDQSLKSQLAGQKIYAYVSSAKEKETPEPVSLMPNSDNTMFQGVYKPRQVGNMAVQVQILPLNAGTDAKPIVDTPRVPFQVKLEALEARDTSANLEGMKDLAEQTSGKYFDYHNMNEVATLVDSIPKDPQVLSHPVVVEIWDGAIFELLFLVLICAEWSLRKLWGLL